MKKILLIIAALLILTVTAALLTTYFKVFHTKPLTQQELTLLTPHWSKITHNNWSPWHTLPDGTKEWNPAASYNTWIDSIPNEDKAWPIIADTWLANLDYTRNLPTGFFPEEDLLWEVHKEDYQSQRFRAIADRYVAAANKPYMGIGIYQGSDPFEHKATQIHGLEDEHWDPNQDRNTAIISAWFADLGQTRQATQFLKSAAASALINNNPDDYIRYTTAVIFLPKLSIQSATLIHQLVQIALIAEATDLVRWGLANNQSGFTTDQLNQLDQGLAQYESIHYLWEGEALQVHDIFRRFAGPDGKISLREQALKLADLRGLSIDNPPANQPDNQLGPSIQKPLVIFNKISIQFDENSQTLFNNINTNPLDVFEQHKPQLNKITEPLIQTQAESLTKITARYRGINQQLRAARIAIAIHIHHNTHKKFPDSLDQLNLPEHVLLDEFTGNQLLYKRTASGPILYSTGDNRVDNNATQRYIKNDNGDLGNPLPYTEPRYQLFLTNEQTQQFVPGAPIYNSGDWVLYPLPFGDPKPIYIPEEDLP